MYINITGRFRVRLISRWNYTWQLQDVSGIRCYSSQELLLWIKKCILTSFVTFVIRSEGKAPNQQFVSLSHQCSSTTIGFGQGFPSKEQCDNTGASPILSLPVYSLFLPVSLTVISIGGTALLSCYWHYSQCDNATLEKSPPPQHVHMTHHRRELRPSVSRSPTCGSRVNDERLRCLN